MSPGADLFVVCKQCGSEVSPYVTECPYCGHRLQRRAPKLPRENVPRRRSDRSGARVRRPSLERLRRHRRRASWERDGRPDSPPYATIVLVAVSCATWVAWHGGFIGVDKLLIVGPLRGDWWKLVASQFTYLNGLYEFAALVAIAIFGWLLERRRGPAVVIMVFLAAGVTGALVAGAVYSQPIVSGGNGAALGLIAAWAAPDLEAARAGYYYEGDLLGAGMIAAVLLAMPLALPEVSWLAGVTGGALGLVIGLGIHRVDPPEL
jgi:hypothetical protein